MNYAELIRSLTKPGCCFRRYAKGGHKIWRHLQLELEAKTGILRDHLPNRALRTLV